jgi:hypothetical protein
MSMSQPNTMLLRKCVRHCLLAPGAIQPQLAVAYGTARCYLQVQSLSATSWFQSHSTDLATTIGVGAAATHLPISVHAHDPAQGETSQDLRPSPPRREHTIGRLMRKQSG